jgi:hypothetical protein
MQGLSFDDAEVTRNEPRDTDFTGVHSRSGSGHGDQSLLGFHASDRESNAAPMLTPALVPL